MEPQSGRIPLSISEIPSVSTGKTQNWNLHKLCSVVGKSNSTAFFCSVSCSVFKHKQHYNLYIFQNQRAFNLCNFSQATLLTKPNTTSFTVNFEVCVLISKFSNIITKILALFIYFSLLFFSSVAPIAHWFLLLCLQRRLA